jgi:nucleotide-binding universal stress UspA family protein
MPAFGVAIIVFGGLLSTMSALNATVMASSRVAFSMGRDRLLPFAMATIHPERRTPHIAIMVTGVILLAMALTLPIEAVGSAASLIFLLTFAMVNLSVITLRRKAPDLRRRYKVPFYPLVPVLGIVLNLILAVYQFSFQPLAWYVTGGWILLGLILYYGYFQKQAAGVQPQILAPSRVPVVVERDALVVPLHNPDHVPALLNYAKPIAKARALRTVAMSVVQVPRQLPIHEGLRFAHHREALLKKGREHAISQGVDLETELVVAHQAHDGILAGARRSGADLLVMGWKGYTDTRDRIFGEVTDQVIRNAPCDLALLKVESAELPKRCLFPTAGGAHALLAAELLNILAPAFGMSITACQVVEPNAGAQARAESHHWIDKTLGRIGPEVAVDRLLIESESVAGGIAKASKDFDLVVLGAAREPIFQQVLFGEIPKKVARYSPASVLVVKQYEGHVRSMFKRTFG